MLKRKKPIKAGDDAMSNNRQGPVKIDVGGGLLEFDYELIKYGA
jgi:hypothetical protein